MKPLYWLFHLSLKEDEQIANPWLATNIGLKKWIDSGVFGNFIVYGINWLKITTMIFYRLVVCIVFVFKFYDALCSHLCIHLCSTKMWKVTTVLWMSVFKRQFSCGYTLSFLYNSKKCIYWNNDIFVWVYMYVLLILSVCIILWTKSWFVVTNSSIY